MLNELKWRSKSKHPFNRPGWSDLHVVVGSLRNVATRWHVAKTFRHLGEGIIGVEETTRHRIDEGDPTRHIREHFLVEDHLALEALLGLHLPLVIPAAQPCEDRGENDQPSREYGHSS